MQRSDTALVLVGFQNDYFSEDGILREFLKGEARERTLENLGQLLQEITQNSELLVVSAPIQFTTDYSEINDPVGILQSIIDVGAFREGQKGTEAIPLIQELGDRVVEVPGRRGLNAFSNTDLEDVLRGSGIRNVVLAGVVTSLCIDSTARSAHDLGFLVHILSDCTAGRTDLEQQFYTDEIFPMYAQVISYKDFLQQVDSSPAEEEPSGVAAS
jgi:nicotinamidase-related amidase